MSRNKLTGDSLSACLPAGCSPMVVPWFNQHHVMLWITRTRRSKLGDFRSGSPSRPPVISVNHSLNPYSFLITLLHEMAHAEVFLKYKRHVQPHGVQWKDAYRRLSLPFLAHGILPDDIRGAFGNYLINPAASSTSDVNLAAVLRRYDPPRDVTLISELPEAAVFALPDGRVFRKGDKLRKRYKCECLNNKRIYLFSPLAEIIPFNPEQSGTIV
ncbi:MAG: SprT-like domain-containing protein [Lentimicrobium sp.]|uniref:SprT-like domain-containing protein n=1 Tax=Lentimicrobium sp. TaxID=2034841 RepID=UPI0025D52088|nr:SprT-like domain-containing protein [Lentimicrobium sp.]MCO5255807.1 SprT-like domain-containing protein [Lentimicrobium sp.]